MNAGNSIVMAVFLPLAGTAAAATIHVPADHPTVQAAIQQAELFDTIIVSPGTYNGAVNLLGKTLTLQSTDPSNPDVVAATVLTTSRAGPVVRFTGGEDPKHTILDGFTIAEGTLGVEGHGALAPIRRCNIRDHGSIAVWWMNGPLEDCQIFNNAAALVDCRGTISRCTVRNNHGDALSNCYGTIRDSRIEFNATAVSGGGIDILRCRIESNGNGIARHTGNIADSYIIGSTNSWGLYGGYADRGIVRNCVIAGNRGDGIQLSNKNVLNCTITGNAGGGIVGHRGYVRNSILWNNLESQYSGSQTPLFSGFTNPFFLQPGAWDDENAAWVHWDYHLTPSSSSYLNAGSPNYADDPDAAAQDLDGNPRIAEGRVDIGAFEFQEECGGADFDLDGLPDNCDGDIDDDGVPNLVDRCDDTFAETAVDAEGRPLADLNQDCVVNLADFAIMQNSLNVP